MQPRLNYWYIILIIEKNTLIISCLRYYEKFRLRFPCVYWVMGNLHVVIEWVSRMENQFTKVKN